MNSVYTQGLKPFQNIYIYNSKNHPLKEVLKEYVYYVLMDKQTISY